MEPETIHPHRHPWLRQNRHPPRPRTRRIPRRRRSRDRHHRSPPCPRHRRTTTHPAFIDDITNLQKHRQMRITGLSGVHFYDRSPICTYALSVWLGFPISKTLAAEMERIDHAQIYQKQVFFIENLGHCEPTAARKITFEDSLKFEKVHEETYRSFGYECIRIAPQRSVRPSRTNHALRLRCRLAMRPAHSLRESENPIAQDSAPENVR